MIESFEWKRTIVPGDNVKCQRLKSKCRWFEIKLIYVAVSVSNRTIEKWKYAWHVYVLMCVNNCRTLCIYLFMLYCWWINSAVNWNALDIIDVGASACLLGGRRECIVLIMCVCVFMCFGRNWCMQKHSHSNTYRANFANLRRHRAGWWCSWSLHFAHRLQSFTTDWHFLLVVVIISLLLSDKQLITMTRKIGWTFRHFRLICRINCRLCHRCCVRCMCFNFGLFCCGRLLSFLQDINVEQNVPIINNIRTPGFKIWNALWRIIWFIQLISLGN